MPLLKLKLLVRDIAERTRRNRSKDKWKYLEFEIRQLMEEVEKKHRVRMFRELGTKKAIVNATFLKNHLENKLGKVPAKELLDFVTIVDHLKYDRKDDEEQVRKLWT